MLLQIVAFAIFSVSTFVTFIVELTVLNPDVDRGVHVIDICITINLLAGTISELLLLYIIYKISVHARLIKQSIHCTTNSSELSTDD